jgi:hypothetical protein
MPPDIVVESAPRERLLLDSLIGYLSSAILLLHICFETRPLLQVWGDKKLDINAVL